jgi:predicted ArsR family transcriptional regulator
VERVGREAGREIAPPSGRPVGDAMLDALAALGFAPRRERPAPSRLRFVLRNCPYRSAALENRDAVCTHHRGVTAGLLEGIDRGAQLEDFVPKDPVAAGCLIEVAVPDEGQAPRSSPLRPA